jgi:hypothetical protein
MATETTEMTTAQKPDTPVKVVGIAILIAGIIMIIAGGVTWAQVSSQLKAENIVVAEDAANYAGNAVGGPLTAYEQAAIINKHALESTGGKTYAELDREDPVRAVAMNASFLRASLFTSVVSYGVAAMAIGLGVLNILLGWSLTRLANR